MMEGMRGTDIGRAGYNNRTEGNHEGEGVERSGSQQEIVRALSEKGSLAVEKISKLSASQFGTLEQEMNMYGLGGNVLTTLTAEDTEALELLENLSLANDKTAEKRIAREISVLLDK